MGSADHATKTVLCIALLGLLSSHHLSIVVLNALVYSRYRCQLHLALRPRRFATLIDLIRVDVHGSHGGMVDTYYNLGDLVTHGGPAHE